MSKWQGWYLGTASIIGCDEAAVQKAFEAFSSRSAGTEIQVTVSPNTGKVCLGTEKDLNAADIIRYATDVNCKKLVSIVLSLDASHGKGFTCHVVRVTKKAKHLIGAIRGLLGTLRPEEVVIGIELAEGAANPFEVADASMASELVPKGPLKDELISRNALKAQRIIGSGQFGEVFLADYQMSPAAVKLLKVDKPEDSNDFLREASVMLKFRGTKNIAQILGVNLDGSPILVIIEYLKFGDLHGALTQSRNRGFVWTPREQLHMCAQIAAAMEFIAGAGFVHIDLATRNCLLGDNNVIKISDFGLTRPLDEGKDYHKMTYSTSVLPTRWMSIEACQEGIFSQKSDVWAFGMVVWEILGYGAKPFSGNKLSELQKQVKEGLRPRKRAPIPIYNGLCEPCWEANPESRPTFTELLKTIVDMGSKQPVAPHRNLGSLSRIWYPEITENQIPLCNEPDYFGA